MISQPVRPNFELGGGSEVTAAEFIGEIYGIEQWNSTRSLCVQLFLSRPPAKRPVSATTAHPTTRGCSGFRELLRCFCPIRGRRAEVGGRGPPPHGERNRYW